MTSKSTIPWKEQLRPSAVPWTPHQYQKDGVKWLIEHACAALFASPGVGKSSMTLAAIAFLKKRGLVNKVLMIAPRRVCYSVWPEEVKKWADFNHLKVVVLHGPKKDEALEEDADIYCVNPEGLDWLLGVNKRATGSKTIDKKRWKELNFDTLVVDELSKFKHTQTQRFKLLKQVLGTFRRRWGLTGSPAANGLMGLFGQTYVLDMGNAFGPYITQFRQTYYVPSYNGYDWTLKEGAEPLIYERLEPLVMRIGSEHLDLPEVVERTIKVQLDDRSKVVYGELEEHLFAAIDENVVTAANSAVASGKCRQVASGGLYLEEAQLLGATKPKNLFKTGSRQFVKLHDAKVDALEDLVEELQGQPLLVGYDFEHDLARIQQRLGDVPYIGGGVSDKVASKIQDDWNQGKLPILLGHPASMGHGLNLQNACRHICWFSLTWDYELYEQFVARVYRQGNKADHVFIYHLVADDTIDEAVYWSLKAKRKGQSALFDGLQELKKVRASRK